mmetsp:Transcript_23522/g.46341  ORF Transcript_23522/g.46341 Transcript_23522/m.46341 type:complete len:160 (-) Transcript_23522:54-533(-)
MLVPRCIASLSATASTTPNQGKTSTVGKQTRSFLPTVRPPQEGNSSLVCHVPPINWQKTNLEPMVDICAFRGYTNDDYYLNYAPGAYPPAYRVVYGDRLMVVPPLSDRTMLFQEHTCAAIFGMCSRGARSLLCTIREPGLRQTEQSRSAPGVRFLPSNV